MTDGVGTASRERSPDEIRRDIAAKQQEIAVSLERIGDRFEETCDWRAQAARHPYLAALVAAGVGLSVISVFRPGRRDPARRAVKRANDAVTDAIGSGRPREAPAVDGAPSPWSVLAALAVEAGVSLAAAKVREVVSARRSSSNGRIPDGNGQRLRRGAWGVSR
jgi:hypothetical protein